MKAAVWYGKDDIRVEDVPLPKIDDYECLLEVKYCGLCKTDVKKIKDITLTTKGKIDPPRVFGHEIVGEIYKVGKKVKNWKEGDRVAIYHHVPCNNCYYCYNLQFTSCETYKTIDTSSSVGKPSGGGFGEFVRVPHLILEKGTIRIPDDVDYKRAVFMEPTNCCLKGIDKADVKIGDTIAIIGQGPIGLTLDQLALLNGAKVVGVDLVDYRLRKAKSLGVEHVVNAAKVNSVEVIKGITNNIGVDKTIVAVEESAAVRQAIKYTRPGGTVVFFSEFGGESGYAGEEGLGREIIDGIYSKELTVIGSYSSSFLRHLDAANLVFLGKIKTEELISHIISLEELSKFVNIVSRRRPTLWDEIVNNTIVEDTDPPENERTFKVLVKP